MSPSTPSTSDEPIVGVVVDHPIPQPVFGFDVGPGGTFFAAAANSTLENGEWKLIGFTDASDYFFEEKDDDA